MLPTKQITATGSHDCGIAVLHGSQSRTFQ